MEILLFLFTSYALTAISVGFDQSPPFPSNFLFGTASSSYQYEGAYLSDGRGTSNWDVFSHKPGSISDGSNGDVAVDQYHRYLEDIDLMDAIKVNSYRFSISWARILPKGRFGEVNLAGVNYYNRLIDALLLKGIQPFVTLFHFDYPQELEDRYGGWLSPQSQEDFQLFADICFKYFGDRVKYWITFNEPNLHVPLSYRNGEFPPCRCSGKFGNCSEGDSEKEPFVAAHNIILSHAAAIDIYRNKYQTEQGGEIGIVVHGDWFKPLSNSTADKLAAERAQSFSMNWILDPILFGKYPKEMEMILGNILPKFSSNDMAKLKGGLDFIGLNHYASYYVRDCMSTVCEPGPGISTTEGLYQPTAKKDGVPIGELTPFDWLNVYPRGMKEIVIYLRDRYNNTPIFITENGYGNLHDPDQNEEEYLNDFKRVNYMSGHLDNLMAAIREGADVRGYFAWSLLDNFEWKYGFSVRFGLYHVDYATLKRTPKLSASWYKQFIAKHKNENIIPEDDRVKKINWNKQFKKTLFLGIFLLPLLPSYNLAALSNDLDLSPLPSNFLFGTASSSYQYEGAYKSDGKGLSNWDNFTHGPGRYRILDGSDGDIAVDHYHRYLEDIDLMEALKVNSHRLSISWARILPKGRFGEVNWAGIDFYNKLIDALLLKGIQPFVTLSHYDNPQELEDRYGGWLSPQSQEDFAFYADLCFKTFGDRVKYWVTFNEPNQLVPHGYRSGVFPPCRCSGSLALINCKEGDSEKEPFVAAHNIILSHAAAVDIYRTKYQTVQRGRIGIVLQHEWFEPISNSTADILATERARSFTFNWFLDPIIFGKYPTEMENILGNLLPKFSSNEKEKLEKGLDFIGINYYTAYYVQDCLYSTCKSGFGASKTEGFFMKSGEKNGVPIGEPTSFSWLNIHPQGMEKAVTYVKDRYNNIPMFITENGYAQPDDPNFTLEEHLNDLKRIKYLTDHLEALFAAMRKGADVRGYFAWSLLDNFEWLYGYTIRYGFHHVDYATLKRTPRLSASWYKQFIAKYKENSLPEMMTGVEKLIQNT